MLLNILYFQFIRCLSFFNTSGYKVDNIEADVINSRSTVTVFSCHTVGFCSVSEVPLPPEPDIDGIIFQCILLNKFIAIVILPERIANRPANDRGGEPEDIIIVLAAV